jgi:hypothetical protein
LSGLNNLGYFAGILDGEGSFFMEQNQKNYKTPTKNWKTSYRWRVRGANAVAILKICCKYFSIRRKEKANSLIKQFLDRRKHVV